MIIIIAYGVEEQIYGDALKSNREKRIGNINLHPDEKRQNIEPLGIFSSLSTNSITGVYQTLRVSETKSLIIKSIENRFPSLGELLQFCNQCNIAEYCNLSPIVNFYRLETDFDSWVMVIESGDICLNEYVMLPSQKVINDEAINYFSHINKLKISYYLGDYQQAIESAKTAQKYLELINAINQRIFTIELYFYDSLRHIELSYLIEDLPKMIASMKIGCERIREISRSLRTFSRSDSITKVEADIHEGIDSTLMILQHRLKANENRPAIQIVKNYTTIPRINCYLGQLNQVFMNLLANAIDSFDELNKQRTYLQIESNPNTISITTVVSASEEEIIIKIQDNGVGIRDDIKALIFNHSFTTKTIGKGTGLGLSISKQIIEEKHNGQLNLESQPGKGSEFIIVLPRYELD